MDIDKDETGFKIILTYLNKKYDIITLKTSEECIPMYKGLVKALRNNRHVINGYIILKEKEKK
jgi:hypothetical protein